MLAWLLIGLTLTLDVPVRELFKWVGPLVKRFRESLKRLPQASDSAKDEVDVQANGFTPMQRPHVPVGVPQAGEAQVGVPTTTSSGQPTIEWVLPTVTDILYEGSAP